MEAILDLSKPLDVPLLDRIITLFYGGGDSSEAKQAGKILEQYSEHPDSWTQVHLILSQSQNQPTKYFALQILEKLITVRWRTLDKTQQEGIRSFIINEIVKVGSTEEGLVLQKVYLRKLNSVLIDILKYEWPHNWPGFITEIVNSSRSNLFLCENNMNILKLLSEEVFEYSAEQMTRNKTKNMQNQLTVEISQIFSLCYEVLSKADKHSLIFATLETLLGVLSWIPSGYILETDIVKILVTKYLEIPVFRVLTLKCLSEINNIEFNDPSQANLPELLMMVMKHISSVLDLNINLSDIYENLSDEEQSLILNLTLYLTSFFTNFLKLVETDKYFELLNHCHNLLLNITLIDDKEIFKICIEYWTGLVTTLFNEIKDSLSHDGKLLNLSMQGAVPPSFLTAFPLRMHQYKPVLSQLRVNLIDRMPKPEEVLVVENEDGEVVRETTQETDALEIYNSTKSCLVILTHLDFDDTHQIMKDKLARQIDGSNWSWSNLNRLCWAIGSISGTTSESSEKQFIVGIIKDLLGLCDFKKGKDNKAIVASNIMYVVGQYPRFLKKHWKFLKTVVNKLFEFMHESHEGVQDMACDTLKHITTRCGRHFVQIQADEQAPFILDIIKHLPRITSDLVPNQICVVYECLGQMVYSDNGPPENEYLIQHLMNEPNEFWKGLINNANSDPSALKTSDKIKLFNYFLRINIAVSTYTKHLFRTQIAYLYTDLLKLYTSCSNIISQAVQENPNYGHVTPVVRGVRSVKKDILKLITSYVNTCKNQDEVASTMVPSLFEVVLNDYNNMVNGAKEVEVLKLLCALTHRLEKRLTPHLSTVLNTVFGCTMNMICADFTDHLDVRLEFFTVIRNIVRHCFDFILSLPTEGFETIYKSVVWASKHSTHDISEIGLTTFSELIDQFQLCPEAVRNNFFSMCLYTMLQDVVTLITDRDHKSGFASQCRIMVQVLKVVKSNVITIHLFNPQTVNDPSMTNDIYFADMVVSTFDRNFPHIGRQNVTSFVSDLFLSIDDLPVFKLKMMDFLIQIKEFGDTSDLMKQDLELEKERKAQEAREAALKIPGMIKPANLPPGMDD